MALLTQHNISEILTSFDLMKGPFLSIEPCDALKQYIACYYFIKSDDPGFVSRHYSFPHTYNALNIYKDSAFEATPHHFKVSESATPNYSTFIQKKQQAPLMVDISGKINRATILFKDFGINHFISQPLAGVMGYDDKRFREWDSDLLFAPFIADLFATDDINRKKEILDHFLLQKLNPVNLADLEQAVALLCNFEQNWSVNAIAQQLSVSVRTFNRYFKEALGVSPVEYRRIAQFRRSLNDKLLGNQFKRLTEIGYNSNFYDQSYFIKMYKKLTGSNPKAFFNAVEKLGDDQLIFQFVKK
jgi:AraC-like DNA-binding protein